MQCWIALLALERVFECGLLNVPIHRWILKSYPRPLLSLDGAAVEVPELLDGILSALDPIRLLKLTCPDVAAYGKETADWVFDGPVMIDSIRVVASNGMVLRRLFSWEDDGSAAFNTLRE